MTFLFAAHSLVRYAVLAAGLALAFDAAVGLAIRRAPGPSGRVLGATFTGLLDLQVALGLAMVALGRFYPALVGHIAMMALAAGFAHAAFAVDRRRPERSHALPLAAAVGALVLVAGGITAIGRSPLAMTAIHG